MSKDKLNEIKEFRKNILGKYIKEAKKRPNKYLIRKNLEHITILPSFKKPNYKKTKLNMKNPPLSLVREALLNGERKECPLGYIYVEYKGYRSYLHRLVVLDNNISIPKGYGVHHIDKNKLNNDLSNLLVLSWEEHRKIHNQK